MDELDDHPEYTCEHDWDHPTMTCVYCGITKEAVAAGRDKPPTWEDVDNAYIDGRALGMVIGALDYKKRRRRKLIEVGYYLCLRRLAKPRSEGGL